MVLLNFVVIFFLVPFPNRLPVPRSFPRYGAGYGCRWFLVCSSFLWCSACRTSAVKRCIRCSYRFRCRHRSRCFRLRVNFQFLSRPGSFPASFSKFSFLFRSSDLSTFALPRDKIGKSGYFFNCCCYASDALVGVTGAFSLHNSIKARLKNFPAQRCLCFLDQLLSVIWFATFSIRIPVSAYYVLQLSVCASCAFCSILSSIVLNSFCLLSCFSQANFTAP